MRKADIYMHGIKAATLTVNEDGSYHLIYFKDYLGPAISLSLPKQEAPYIFSHFPAFFDGLLPEGEMLNALLKRHKLDEDDYLSQLIQTGNDLIGAVTIKEGK